MATINVPYPDDANAPFGYEEDGKTPKAPLGYKSDGKPRISNRGRKSGNGTPSPARRTTARKKGGRTNAQRRDMLLELTDMWITTPLAALSKSSAIAKRIGEKQTDALAGDAVIIDAHKEGLVDGLIYLSQSKPGVLAWMDSVEEKAPWMMLAMVGLQITQAVVQNHMNPDPRLAEGGRALAMAKAERFASMVEAETETIKDAA